MENFGAQPREYRILANEPSRSCPGISPIEKHDAVRLLFASVEGFDPIRSHMRDSGVMLRHTWLLT